MKHEVYISEPYREVCYVCGQRKQVVALHFPVDLGGRAVSSTRLCQACATAVARRLLPAPPEEWRRVQTSEQF